MNINGIGSTAGDCYELMHEHLDTRHLHVMGEGLTVFGPDVEGGLPKHRSGIRRPLQ